MPANSPKRLIPIALVALVFGLYGWAILVATGTGFDGKIGPFYNAVGGDWAIFHTAIQAWRDGELTRIYDQVWLGRTVNSNYGRWFIEPLTFPAFHYPPTWLVFLAPFSVLPFMASYIAFQSVSFAALLAALRKTYGDRLQFWATSASLLLCPASSNNVLAGQNGFLVCALFLLGVPLLEAQPFVAGAMLGLISFKPQVSLMIPFALLGARNWRAVGGAAVSAAALALLSLLVFGPDVWRTWIGLMLHPRHDVAYTGIDFGRSWDESVFTCAQLLGASKPVANLVQGAATLGAGACVYFSFRRPMATDLRFAVLLAATVVGAPHVSPYDMTLLALAATIVVWNSLDGDYRPLALALPMLAWMAPLYNPPRATPVGLMTPLVIFGLIAMAMIKGRKPAQAIAAPLPAQA